MKTAHERAIVVAEAANLSRLLHTAKRGVSMDATPDLVSAPVDASVALDRAGVPLRADR